MLFSTPIKFITYLSRSSVKSVRLRKIAEWLVMSWSLVLIFLQAYKFFIYEMLLINRKSFIFSFETIIFFIALIFWISGFFAFIYKKSFIEQVFFYCGVGIIIWGGVSVVNSIFERTFLFFYLAFFSPLVFHFCLKFYKRSIKKSENYLLIATYFLAFLLGFTYILTFVYAGVASQIIGLLEIIARVLITMTTGCALLLQISNYRHFSNLTDRRQIRFILFGIVFGLTPFNLWYVVIEFFGISFANVELAIPWLILIPITYLYSNVRVRLQFQEYALRTFLVNTSLGLIFLCLFLIALEIETLIPVDEFFSKILLAFSITLVFVFFPLKRILFNWANWLFYGNEADYKTSIVHLEELLANVLNRESLVDLLLDELTAAIKPTSIAIFLQQKENSLSFEKGIGLKEPWTFHKSISTSGNLAQILIKNSRPIVIRQINEKIPWDRLPQEEISIIEQFSKSLWIPLISENKLEGLILISRGKGRKHFSEKEIQILFHISSKIGSTIRNVILAETILSSQQEIIRAHYKLILTQEEERKRIARDLHDNTIQQLIGVNLQIGNIINQLDTTSICEENKLLTLKSNLGIIRTYLSESVTGIRKMISELRPAGLDELGICFTLENLVENARRDLQKNCPEIILNLDAKADDLPEIYTICVYRITQEALNNIIKHADATKVTIDLHVFPEGVEMEIEDNGVGFEIPKHLSELALSHHFGLIGIVERVQNLGGIVLFISQIGVGTRIKTVLPQ